MDFQEYFDRQKATWDMLKRSGMIYNVRNTQQNFNNDIDNLILSPGKPYRWKHKWKPPMLKTSQKPLKIVKSYVDCVVITTDEEKNNL